MKVIIAGTRSLTDMGEVVAAIRAAKFDISEVVCGDASGADTFGANWAKMRDIPVKYFRADWKQHGKAAGPIRNGMMADYAEALIAVWDGASPGTQSMIREAERRGLRVYVHLYKEVV
jgi:hypothetical protein